MHGAVCDAGCPEAWGRIFIVPAQVPANKAGVASTAASFRQRIARSARRCVSTSGVDAPSIDARGIQLNPRAVWLGGAPRFPAALHVSKPKAPRKEDR